MDNILKPNRICEFSLFCIEKDCLGKKQNRKTELSCGLRRGWLMHNNKRIYLQSFFSKPLGLPFSVARWQPKGYSYRVIDFLQPSRVDGSAIKKLPPETEVIYLDGRDKPVWSRVELYKEINL